MSNSYNVISIEKITPPEGAEGKNWYQYTIGRNKTSMDRRSIITGARRGTLKQVTLYAEEFANTLNVRNGKYGKSLWTVRSKKPD